MQVWVLCLGVASTSALHAPALRPLRRGSLTSVRCCDSSPSDSADIDCDEDGNCDVPSSSINADEDRLRLKTDILRLSAACNRGEAASIADRDAARTLVSSLEALNPTPEPTRSRGALGTWELIFADTQLFRSSPFFMAGRAVCADGDEAQRYDWFCDMHRAALAISTIGKVRQVVDGERVVSEFEVTVGAVPFVADVPLFGPRLAYSGGLPVAITGSIVSTATVESNVGDGWTLLMDTVEVKGSNVPLLRQALDAGVRLPTRQLGRAIQTLSPTYANPTPIFRTTYLDESLRISRDQDGKIFVYTKQSDATVPTDYSAVSSDLGLLDLLTSMATRLVS